MALTRSFWDLVQRRAASDPDFAKSLASEQELRTAAEAGIAAIENGRYKEFPDAASLARYFDGVAGAAFSEPTDVD